jgi:hypothetical protein
VIPRYFQQRPVGSRTRNPALGRRHPAYALII